MADCLLRIRDIPRPRCWRWVAAIAGLALVVLIGIMAGIAAAEAAVGVVVLLYGLTLLVTGITAAPLVPKWCRSNHPVAIRVLGVGVVFLAPYFFVSCGGVPVANARFV